MFNKSLTGGKKNAAITIEVTLSVALSILVLFLALGLFSDNLATMAANSGIQNLFNRSNEVAKTNQNKWGKVKTNIPTVNVNSQENVQVVADQGQTITLAQYLEQAQQKIANYNQNPPTTPDQVKDLAEQLTIAKIGNITTDSAGQTINFASYYTTYGIKVTLNRLDGHYTTKINTATITGDYNLSSQDGQLNSIKDVINRFS